MPGWRSLCGKRNDSSGFVLTSALPKNELRPRDVYGGSRGDPGRLDRKHPTEVYDFHATILRLLGIDHTKLTFRHQGIDRRLTDVHGRALEELLA